MPTPRSAWTATCSSPYVFSSRTGEWALFDLTADLYHFNNSDAMRAGRFVYWRSNSKKQCKNEEQILLLDIATMGGQSPWRRSQQGSHIGSPTWRITAGCASCPARSNAFSSGSAVTMDGYSTRRSHCWISSPTYLKKLRREEWMKRVRVLTAKAGYVYMEFWSIRKPNLYLLVLNLNTMKLEIFRNDSDEPFRVLHFHSSCVWNL
uniref:Uncharacterized protein n=1 Tax=Leersia perrieri TaxID=77586 RepID=A0A0D9XBH3_9ORYZ